jgi:hypothetical protein
MELSSVFVVQLQGHLFFGNVQQVVLGIQTALREVEESLAADAETGTEVEKEVEGGSGHSITEETSLGGRGVDSSKSKDGKGISN